MLESCTCAKLNIDEIEHFENFTCEKSFPGKLFEKVHLGNS